MDLTWNRELLQCPPGRTVLVEVPTGMVHETKEGLSNGACQPEGSPRGANLAVGGKGRPAWTWDVLYESLARPYEFSWDTGEEVRPMNAAFAVPTSFSGDTYTCQYCTC